MKMSTLHQLIEDNLECTIILALPAISMLNNDIVLYKNFYIFTSNLYLPCEWLVRRIKIVLLCI